MSSCEHRDTQVTILGRERISLDVDLIVAVDDHGQVAIWSEVRGDRCSPEGLTLAARQASGVAALLWRAAQQAARSYAAGGA